VAEMPLAVGDGEGDGRSRRPGRSCGWRSGWGGAGPGDRGAAVAERQRPRGDGASGSVVPDPSKVTSLVGATPPGGDAVRAGTGGRGQHLDGGGGGGAEVRSG
jgi:hypothetical protein